MIQNTVQVNWMSLYLGQQCCRAWPLASASAWLAGCFCSCCHIQLQQEPATRVFGPLRLGGEDARHAASSKLVFNRCQWPKTLNCPVCCSWTDAALAAFAVYTEAWLLFAGQFAGCIWNKKQKQQKQSAAKHKTCFKCSQRCHRCIVANRLHC